MGCTVSIRKTVSPKKRVHDDEDGTEEMQKYLLPPPNIPLTVGSGVLDIEQNDPVLIFIFGGPGSMKGVLMEELVAEFNFKVLGAEDIVLQYLPNKVANSSATTQEIQDLLKTDPSLIQFEWVMHLISAKLLTSVERRYIIDIIPNISSIQKAECFSTDSFQEQLQLFEQKHPINFALNLTVPGGKIELAPPININKSSDQVNGKADDKENGTDKSSNDKKKQVKQSIFAEGIDEGDMSRTRRRFETYRAIATPMLRYFERTKRVVTMEVTSNSQAHVQKKLRDVLLEFGILPGLSPVTVVLFVFSDMEIDGLDTHCYGMIRLKLSSMVMNDKNWIDQIKSIKQKINEEKCASNNFVVILDNIHWMPATEQKRLSFIDMSEKEDYLDKFIHFKPMNKAPRLFKKKVKSIFSPTGETFLFSTEMKLAMCKDIAMIMFDKKSHMDQLQANSNSDGDSNVSESSVLEDRSWLD